MLRAGAAAIEADKLNRKAMKAGRRLRVFTNSMSDFFDNHASITDEVRDIAWYAIRRCTSLDWLVLTKRPQNITRYLPLDWGEGWAHVWLGSSGENQVEADRRWEALAKVPNAMPWMSFEPLLAPVVLRAWWPIGWGVIGGETGKGRRDCGVEPIVALSREHRARGIPVFVKQDSAHGPDKQGRIPDSDFIREWPASPASSGKPSLGHFKGETG